VREHLASIASDRLLAIRSGVLGATALLLVAIGIYGTLSYGIVRRRRELGVRLALGANRRDIVRLVLAGALTPIVSGVTIGVPLSLLVGRIAQATLFWIAPTDTATYLVGIAVLLGVAVCAARLPSSRAARTDPIEALHQD
jgi:ABC-type antimicrobial peptide transport system permease subunit